MNDLREAARLALGYLKDNQHLVADNERHVYVMEYNAFIDKLEKMLEQPVSNPDEFKCPICYDDPANIKQPARKWVGLTDEEIKHIYKCETGGFISDSDPMLVDFARAIEAKLKEKNT